MERQSSYKIKFESFKLPRSIFSRLEISMFLMGFFCGTFEMEYFRWVAVVSGDGSLSGMSPNTA